MEEKNKKRQIAKITVFITSIFVIFMSVTYAFITQVLTGEKQVVVSAGVLDLVLEEENAITISDAYPMYDQVGMIQKDVFNFRLVNKTNNPTDYVLKLQKVETANELSEDDVKYYLTKEGVGTPALLSTLTNNVVDTGTIEGKDTIDYTLRLWIDSKVTSNDAIAGKSLSYKLKVEATQEIRDENNCKVYAETEPNKPQLTSGMIAVTYNATDKTWVKADTSNNDWYDYDNQIWANAVTVTEATRDTYMSAEANTPILMDDINTMWVWIPRYSYTIKQPNGRGEQKCSELGEITVSSPSNCRKVEYPAELRAEALNICKQMDTTITTETECVSAFQTMNEPYKTFEEFIDAGVEYGVFEDTRTVVETYPDNIANVTIEQPGAIDIRFIKTTEKDTGTGKCENCAENWVTPEGFTFGEENIPGFWMGKFETSTLESCTATTDSIGTECDLTTLTPQIKPGVTSWRGARVSTFFEASRLMQSSDDTLNYNADTYGFDTQGASSMDTHMLKNTEWGIVAMLSHSKYGKYGNENYTGAEKEVAINNCSSYITGIGGDTVSANSSSTTCTTNTYETSKGQTASTTGTIYGVYDMSGGAYEYVMGNLNNDSGYSTSYNSGFCGTDGPAENCRERPNAKYFDLYTSDNASEGYKSGDGTYETSGWYSDNASFVNSYGPWFERGGGGSYDNSTNAGVFFSGNYFGESIVDYGVRFVIKP